MVIFKITVFFGNTKVRNFVTHECYSNTSWGEDIRQGRGKFLVKEIINGMAMCNYMANRILVFPNCKFRGSSSKVQSDHWLFHILKSA